MQKQVSGAKLLNGDVHQLAEGQYPGNLEQQQQQKMLSDVQRGKLFAFMPKAARDWLLKYSSP